MLSRPWDQQTDTIPNPQSISTSIVPRRVIVQVIAVITLSRWWSCSNDKRQCGSRRRICCGLRRDIPLHKQWAKEKRLVTAMATQMYHCHNNYQECSSLCSTIHLHKDSPLSPDNCWMNHFRFGATHFLEALCTFIHKHIPTCKISPHVFDHFDVYKQINIHLPYNRYLSNHPWTNHIHTTPATAKLGRKAATAACFDTALLVENWEDHDKFGGLEGIYFLVSGHLLTLILHPRPLHCSGTGNFPVAQPFWILPTPAGITPLVQPDNLTGMHIITWSTRSHCRNAAVVFITDIVHGCHLMGKSGLKIDPTWTMDNVLDLASHFYLNPYYINVDSFTSYYF